MKLVTCHPYGFDITSDKLDLSKSGNLNEKFDLNSMFKNAYEWLFKIIGNNELIWCYKLDINAYKTAKSNGNHLSHGDEKVIWSLEVPDKECIVINSHAWECVINGWAYCKEELVRNISDDDYEKLMESLEPTKEKDWADNIFNIEDSEYVEVLIKSPVNKDFVVDKQWICDYDCSKFNNKDDCMIRSLYHDKEQLDKDIEIYESALKGRKLQYKTEVQKANNGDYLLNIDWFIS